MIYEFEIEGMRTPEKHYKFLAEWIERYFFLTMDDAEEFLEVINRLGFEGFYEEAKWRWPHVYSDWAQDLVFG